jgi:hypothetical protein
MLIPRYDVMARNIIPQRVWRLSQRGHPKEGIPKEARKAREGYQGHTLDRQPSHGVVSANHAHPGVEQSPVAS